MGIDRGEVERFLYEEARLMDEHHYEAWEALWTDDAIYWVPCNADDIDPTRHVSIIYDDRTRIGHRIARLKSGEACAQDPPSRLRRLISNIEITEAENGDLEVRSNFLVIEVRQDQRIWAGATTHRLRQVDGRLKMASKKVLLVNNDRELPPLAFLI
jgi:3-phenylpropionate/cinnamic acid dioxygenase small subunit